MAKFQLYRKAIAALLVAALGVAATFIPGIDTILSATEIQVAAGALAALAVAVTSDKLDGASVLDLARLVVHAMDDATPDPDNPTGGIAGIAPKAIMRAGDPLPLIVSATPLGDEPVDLLIRAGKFPQLPDGGAA